MSNFVFRKIPDAAWERFKQAAAADGLYLRPALLEAMREFVEHRQQCHIASAYCIKHDKFHGVAK